MMLPFTRLHSPAETYWLATGLGAAETEGGRTGDGWEARALLDSGELIYSMRTYTRTKRWVMVPERAINFAPNYTN